MSEEMQAFNQRWVLIADHLQCASCGWRQWPYNAGRPFEHEDGCAAVLATDTYPWRVLAGLMAKSLHRE